MRNKGALVHHEKRFNIRMFNSTPHLFCLPNFMNAFTWNWWFVTKKSEPEGVWVSSRGSLISNISSYRVIGYEARIRAHGSTDEVAPSVTAVEPREVIKTKRMGGLSVGADEAAAHLAPVQHREAQVLSVGG
jgi:hypothetical protein